MASAQPSPEPNREERDRQSYLFWQKTALEQLGYVMNLFLTFAAASVAFAVKTIMDSKARLDQPARFLFYGSIVVFLVSIGAALAATITRALDFRYTRGAAHARWKKLADEHEEYSRKANVLGTWCWRLFVGQTVTFFVGIVLLVLSIWTGYGSKL